VLRADVSDPSALPNQIQILRMNNVNRYVGLPSGWHEEIKKRIVSGGKIIVEQAATIEEPISVSLTDYESRFEKNLLFQKDVMIWKKLLIDSNSGWTLKVGHLNENGVFIVGESGYLKDGKGAHTLFIFENDATSGNEILTDVPVAGASHSGRIWWDSITEQAFPLIPTFATLSAMGVFGSFGILSPPIGVVDVMLFVAFPISLLSYIPFYFLHWNRFILIKPFLETHYPEKTIHRWFYFKYLFYRYSIFTTVTLLSAVLLADFMGNHLSPEFVLEISQFLGVLVHYTQDKFENNRTRKLDGIANDIAAGVLSIRNGRLDPQFLGRLVQVAPQGLDGMDRLSTRGFFALRSTDQNYVIRQVEKKLRGKRQENLTCSHSRQAALEMNGYSYETIDSIPINSNVALDLNLKTSQDIHRNAGLIRKLSKRPEGKHLIIPEPENESIIELFNLEFGEEIKKRVVFLPKGTKEFFVMREGEISMDLESLLLALDSNGFEGTFILTKGESFIDPLVYRYYRKLGVLLDVVLLSIYRGDVFGFALNDRISLESIDKLARIILSAA
jgi:hypothetical protein